MRESLETWNEKYPQIPKLANTGEISHMRKEDEEEPVLQIKEAVAAREKEDN